jgi:hypothetical protein
MFQDCLSAGGGGIDWAEPLGGRPKPNSQKFLLLFLKKGNCPGMEIASTERQAAKQAVLFWKKEPKNFDTFRLSLRGKAEAN